MNFLESVDNPEVKYQSSISQHKNKLSVYAGGEWLPISYDELLYVSCNKMASELAILALGDDIGYTYPVDECCYYSDAYVYHDKQGTELRALPEYFGEGYYATVIDEQDFVNADNGALGTRNKIVLRKGLNYALSGKRLEVVE